MKTDIKELSENLRVLKALLDDGIITDEEFALKKREMLELDPSMPDVEKESQKPAESDLLSDSFMYTIRYENDDLEGYTSSNLSFEKSTQEVLANDNTTKRPVKSTTLSKNELCGDIHNKIDDLFAFIDKELSSNYEGSDKDYFIEVKSIYHKGKDEGDYDSRILFERSRYTERLTTGLNAFLSEQKDRELFMKEEDELIKIIGLDEMPLKFLSDKTSPMLQWDNSALGRFKPEDEQAQYIGVSKYALAFANLLTSKTLPTLKKDQEPKDKKQTIINIAIEAMYMGLWYANLDHPSILLPSDKSNMAKNRALDYEKIKTGERKSFGTWAKPFLEDDIFEKLVSESEGRVILEFGDYIMPLIIPRKTASSTGLFGLFGKPKPVEEKPDPYQLSLLRFLMNYGNVYFKVISECKNRGSKYLPKKVITFP